MRKNLPDDLYEEVTRLLALRDAGKCPFCEIDVKEDDLADELSKKEFKVSGMCQRCQDSFFGKGMRGE